MTDTELAKRGSKTSHITLKSGKKLDITLVEGSFRRITGMREQLDDSGSFTIRQIEISREPGRSLGFYIREGDGWFRKNGIFVSRVNLGSIIEKNYLLSVGDEIIRVNNVDVTKMCLEDVVLIMLYVKRMILTVKMLTSLTLKRDLAHHQSLRRRDLPRTPSYVAREKEEVKEGESDSPYSKVKRKISIDEKRLKFSKIKEASSSSVQSTKFGETFMNLLNSQCKVPQDPQCEINPYEDIDIDLTRKQSEKKKKSSMKLSDISPYAVIQEEDEEIVEVHPLEENTVSMNPYEEIGINTGKQDSPHRKKDSLFIDPYEVVNYGPSHLKLPNTGNLYKPLDTSSDMNLDGLLELLRQKPIMSSSPAVRRKSDLHEDHRVIHPDHIYAQINRQRKKNSSGSMHSNSTDSDDSYELEREHTLSNSSPPPLPTSPLPHDDSSNTLPGIAREESTGTLPFLKIPSIVINQVEIMESSKYDHSKHDPDFNASRSDTSPSSNNAEHSDDAGSANPLDMPLDDDAPPLPPPYIPDESPPDLSNEDDDYEHYLTSGDKIPSSGKERISSVSPPFVPGDSPLDKSGENDDEECHPKSGNKGAPSFLPLPPAQHDIISLSEVELDVMSPLFETVISFGSEESSEVEVDDVAITTPTNGAEYATEVIRYRLVQDEVEEEGYSDDDSSDLHTPPSAPNDGPPESSDDDSSHAMELTSPIEDTPTKTEIDTRQSGRGMTWRNDEESASHVNNEYESSSDESQDCHVISFLAPPPPPPLPPPSPPLSDSPVEEDVSDEYESSSDESQDGHKASLPLPPPSPPLSDSPVEEDVLDEYESSSDEYESSSDESQDGHKISLPLPPLPPPSPPLSDLPVSDDHKSSSDDSQDGHRVSLPPPPLSPLPPPPLSPLPPPSPPPSDSHKETEDDSPSPYLLLPTTRRKETRRLSVSDHHDQCVSGTLVVKVNGLDINTTKSKAFWSERDVTRIMFDMALDDRMKITTILPINDDGTAEEDESSEYYVLLLNNSKVTFTLRLLSLQTDTQVTKLSNIFPPKAKSSLKNVYVEFEEYGHLNLSLSLSPSITRISPGGYLQPKFSDFVSLNPRGSGFPLVLEKCITVIEKYGLKSPHLYERCVKKLYKNKALASCLDNVNSQSMKSVVIQCSVHAYTGLLMDFFIDLPEPFFTNAVSPSLTQVASIGSEAHVLESFIQCLPDEVTNTLDLLLRHFKRLCEYGNSNGVTVKSISRIFGPLLLIPAISSDLNMSTTALEYAEDYEAQAKVIEVLLSLKGN